MKISHLWLKDFVNLGKLDNVDALAATLTSLGLEVEHVQKLGAGLEKVVVAQILTKAPHPNADRLSLCRVKTSDDKEFEIVCGASNMKEKDRVALALPGAVLPNGLKIKSSKIRGEKSDGMLCSEEELGMAQSSEGILILPDDAPIGSPLAEVLGREDEILELNVTPNRGDCLSHMGIARELSAALGEALLYDDLESIPLTGSPIKVSLDAEESAPQFYGCFIEGVEVKDSPKWIKARLEALGVRSINNVVDATNLIMLELGQPMHAYDADQIKGKELQVRIARAGEKLPLLDETEIECEGFELVISDHDRAVALAGVMGGSNSEVTAGTTRLFLECAEFSPTLVRKAARFHRKHTEASHRFERGVDPNGLRRAISRLAALIYEVAGGKCVGGAASFHETRNPKTGMELRSVFVRPGFFTEFLGMEIEPSEASDILKSLGCAIQVNKNTGNEWKVTVPSFRWDLNLPEDLAEEIARFIGYDEIPSTMPMLSSPPQPMQTSHMQRRWHTLDRTKRILMGMGFLENIHYSFTSRKWLDQLGFHSELPIENPLSEDQEVLVPSLLPGLIESASYNLRHHFGSEPLNLRFFEIRPTFDRQTSGAVAAISEMETGIQENWKLALLLSGRDAESGLDGDLKSTDFSMLKGVIEQLLRQLGTKGVHFHAVETPRQKFFHPAQSASLWIGKTHLGVFGLLHPSMAKKLKFKYPIMLMELDWDELYRHSYQGLDVPQFKPWNEFPGMERDFSLLVPGDVLAGEVTRVAIECGQPLAKSSKVFDIYQGSQVPEGMTSLSVRVIFYDKDRSLEEKEVDEASQSILKGWEKELGLRLRT